MVTDNDTIDPEQSQDMSPEDAKASLGVANMLMSQLIPQVPPEGQQMQEMPENEPQKEEMPESTHMEEMQQMEGKFEQFKEDINKTIDDKFGQLSDLIKSALTDDDHEER